MPVSTSPAIRRLYDWLGPRYDWFEFYEGRAKARAFELLDLSPGLRLLNVGAGTGKDHARFARTVQPGGMAVALDLSRVMIQLVARRTGSPCICADAAQLPFPPNSFDCVYAAFVLDLLPTPVLPAVAAQFLAFLRPGGRLVLACLTEGHTRASRGLIAAWKGAYAFSPVACGGCRPLQMRTILVQTGFTDIHREVIIQMAVPSEVILAFKPKESSCL